MIATTLATIGQGIHDYVVMVYPIIILFAGLTAQQRGLFFATLLTLLAFTWLILGEANGWFTLQKTLAADWTDLLVTGILIVTMAWAVYILVSNAQYGLAQTWRELAEQKRIEQALRESEARFRFLFDQSHDAVFLLNLNGRYIMTNQRAADMLGYTVEELAKLSVNDISAEIEKSDHVTKRLLAGEHIPLYERLFRKKDGQIIYVEVNVELVRDKNGNLMHIQSVARNITERKQSEEALNKSEEMYRLLAENISDVIWILDINENRFRYVSPSVERLRGYTVEEVLAQDMSAVFTPDSLQTVQQTMLSSVQSYKDGYRGFYVNEVEQPCKDGSTVWTETTTSFHMNENTGHLEVYGVSRDITERKRLQNELHNYVKEIELLQVELRDQAIRDPLTGLYNRRYMQDVFKREFSRAERENDSVSVIMLDMDGLKIFNDTYGHSIGDRAIKTLATQIQNMIRNEDFCCRYGGDEFIVVLTKANIKDAVKRVEQWRKSLNNHPLEVDGDKKIQVKFTAGVAIFPAHGTSMEEVLNYADVALYRAKTQGRNCTVVFE